MSTSHNRMHPPEPYGLQIRRTFRPERRSLVVRTLGSRGNDRRFETGRPKPFPEKSTRVGRPSTEKRHRTVIVRENRNGTVIEYRKERPSSENKLIPENRDTEQGR